MPAEQSCLSRFRWSLGRLLFPLVLLIANRIQAETNDLAWNQFRGPNGAGVTVSSKPPIKIDSPLLAWKIPLARGLSSPVLSSAKIFLTAVEGNRLVTLAFDSESGGLAWRQEAPAVPLENAHPTSSPAAPTPLVDAERVYVYFGSFGLLCYDHSGRLQWQKQIPPTKTPYGAATSPIGHHDALIVVLDSDGNLPEGKLSESRIVALKKSTGELIWETPRPLVRSGWSTPSIWRHEGGEELVVLGSGRVCGYDPETGAEKWFATGFSRETIAVPISGKNHVFISAARLGGVPDEQPDPKPFWTAMLAFDANKDGKLERAEINHHFTFPLRPELPTTHVGFGIPLPSDPVKRKERQTGIFTSGDKDGDGFWTREEFLANMWYNAGKPRLMAIRPGGRGDITGSHVAWELNRSIPEIPSPLFFQDRIYMVRNGGILTAVDAANGKIVYDERLGADGQYSASPVVANGNLYLFSNRGVVSVVSAGDSFKIVHQHDLGEPVFVTPAFDAAAIYIRTDTGLAAYRNALDKSPK